MISFEESLEMVVNHLSKSPMPLVITYSEGFPDGWLFCFNSKQYVETGDFSFQLVGNGPIFVDKDTGELHFFGTALPPKEYVEEYSLRKRDKK
ncbi:YrhB domain-containing protein [Pseudomonas sp. F16(2018)]|uniref:YrhB domain-containing protein n=1 Tax=Pseudomonas sp. F16(2018) TaxID=2093746 RepID=UPI001118C41C|nr:YrhB domain-containing protein [Pseudomonas sp. F16(2018)]